MNNKTNDTRFKILLSSLWITLQTILIFCTYLISGNKGKIKLYVGGTFKGHVGGGKVKLTRLEEHFKITNLNYNVAYLLSNSQFVSQRCLRILRKRKIPIILNQNGVYYSSWYSGDWVSKNKFMADVYHEADYVFWQSEFCRYAANKFLGDRKGKGEILYNAVDTNKLFIPSNKTKNSQFTFLLTGNLVFHLIYRLETTIHAIFEARKIGLDCKLNIAGFLDDNSLQFSKKLISKLGLQENVSFIGQYNQKDAPSIYQNADAYIITKYKDPCPNSVIEAMSCGLPILYSNSGGVPELVGKKAGIGLDVEQDWDDKIYVPTIDSIVDGMIKIAKNRDKMAKEARLRAIKEFEISNWIHKHQIIFKSLLEKNN